VDRLWQMVGYLIKSSKASDGAGFEIRDAVERAVEAVGKGRRKDHETRKI